MAPSCLRKCPMPYMIRHEHSCPKSFFVGQNLPKEQTNPWCPLAFQRTFVGKEGSKANQHGQNKLVLVAAQIASSMASKGSKHTLAPGHLRQTLLISILSKKSDPRNGGSLKTRLKLETNTSSNGQLGCSTQCHLVVKAS